MIFGSMAKLYLLILITPACFSMQPQRNYPHVHVPNLFDLLLLSAAAEKLSEVEDEDLIETSIEGNSEVSPRGHKHHCPHCNYSARHPWILKNHIAKHTQDYRFICDPCDYKTSNGFNFKRHLASERHKEKIAQ